MGRHFTSRNRFCCRICFGEGCGQEDVWISILETDLSLRTAVHMYRSRGGMDQEILQELRTRDQDLDENRSSEDRVPPVDSQFLVQPGAEALPSQPVPTSFSPFSTTFNSHQPSQSFSSSFFSNPSSPSPDPTNPQSVKEQSSVNGTSDLKGRNFRDEDVDSDLRDMTISPDVMELDSEEEREKEGERQEQSDKRQEQNDQKTVYEIQDSQGPNLINFYFLELIL